MSKKPNVVIIGGGIAGISAALSLADNGHHAYIVEKKASIGGHVMRFGCKATDKCNNCGVCLAKDKIKQATTHPEITIITHAEIARVDKSTPNFGLHILRRPCFVDEQKCIGCSLCYQRCPKPGEAIIQEYLACEPFTFSINKERCLHFKKGAKCSICQEYCPTGAISFDSGEEQLLLDASSIIIATGYEAYDAREKGCLGFGRFPEVISGLDIEERLLKGDDGVIPFNTEGKMPSVAFIQCVGSRDPHIGHDYCSRVCCKYAVRIAAKLKSKFPEMYITIYYIDLQKTERDFSALVESLKADIRLVKGIPIEIKKGEVPGISLRYENIDSGCLEKADHDLIILSIGICPNRTNPTLADILGVDIDKNGFFAAHDLMDSTVSSRQGIFLAGTCQGPKNIIESILHGQEAALRSICSMKGATVIK